MEVYGIVVHNAAPQNLKVPPDGRRQDIGARDMRALIANEPSMYREVISAALKELRPGIEIFTAEPDDLEGSDGASRAVVRGLDGSRTTLSSMGLHTLLPILDSI